MKAFVAIAKRRRDVVATGGAHVGGFAVPRPTANNAAININIHMYVFKD